MSTVSSLTGFSSAFSFTMFQHGSWCTPPHHHACSWSSVDSLCYWNSSSQRGSLSCCRDLSSVSVTITVTLSSDSFPENENLILLGCGSASIDLLATVAAYPKPDEKIRSTSFKVEGGGNAANALTCAARLGLKPRLISKVADDTHGRAIIDELQADGVDMSFIVVSEEGTSPFTYIIVDSQTLEQLLVSLES
ncbi:uncharacterized protein [Arachis hypogaea]|uniref:uncharacterized protein n=1 Tax=Arachis hypogaea TaxID=3818 RepID=UPI003B217365